jgi:hypothetical protein
MTPKTARILLGAVSFALLGLYGFVVFVAFVTSGSELLKMPWTWYAATVPPLYLTFCVFTALDRIPKRALKPLGLIAHLAAAPAIVVSFLGLGMLFPIVALLCLIVIRKRGP